MCILDDQGYQKIHLISNDLSQYFKIDLILLEGIWVVMSYDPETKFKCFINEKQKTKVPKWDDLSDLEEENIDSMRSESPKPPVKNK